MGTAGIFWGCKGQVYEEKQPRNIRHFSIGGLRLILDEMALFATYAAQSASRQKAAPQAAGRARTQGDDRQKNTKQSCGQKYPLCSDSDKRKSVAEQRGL